MTGLVSDSDAAAAGAAEDTGARGRLAAVRSGAARHTADSEDALRGDGGAAGGGAPRLGSSQRQSLSPRVEGGLSAPRRCSLMARALLRRVGAVTVETRASGPRILFTRPGKRFPTDGIMIQARRPARGHRDLWTGREDARGGCR